MATIKENSEWEPSIFQVEVTTPLLGGPPQTTPNGSVVSGHLNVAAQQLANRSLYLKEQTDSFSETVESLDDRLTLTDTKLTSHIGSRGAAHSNATQTDAGFMSASDKTKLNGIDTGAQANVATNLSQGTRTTTTVPVTSSTGTAATLTAATTTLAGVMTSADKIKLNSIADNAQVNQNTFSILAVAGQTSVEADTTSDTLTLVAGSNVSITTNAAADSITISSSAGTVDNTKLPLTGGTLTGDLSGTNTRMLAFIDKTRILNTSSATQALDFTQGDVQDITLSTNTTLTISGVPTLSGSETLTLVLRIRQAATLYTLTWFSNINWLTSGGTAPTAPAINKIGEYIFTTTDGTNWLGRKGAGN